jgi:hypothetical protein
MMELNDHGIHLKVKLSALWAAVMFCDVYSDYLPA